MANMQDMPLIPRHKPSWHKLSGEGGGEGGGVSEWSAGSLFSGGVPSPWQKTSKLKTLLLKSQR